MIANTRHGNATMPLNLRPLNEIQTRPTSWLWTDRIPTGALTIVEGAPGASKSTLLGDIAARVSTGRAMPMSTQQGLRRNVWMFSTEDSDRQLQTRLAVHGADLSRVLRLDALESNRLKLPRSIREMEEEVGEIAPALIVFDPLHDFLDAPMTSDLGVRRCLIPLTNFAQRHGISVVGVRHLTKNGNGNLLYRGAGAVAIAAIARSMLLVERDPRFPDRQLVGQIKSSLGRLAPIVGFRLATTINGAVVEWDGELPYEIDELLHRGRGHDCPRLDEASDVLYSILSEGPIQAVEVYDLAWQASRVTRRTLERAKDHLRVISYRVGFGPGAHYYWRLNEDDVLVQQLRERDVNGIADRPFNDEDEPPTPVAPSVVAHLLSADRPIRRRLTRDPRDLPSNPDTGSNNAP